MGLDDLHYHTIGIVLETWELGRQKFGNSKELSMSILLKLFEMDPSTKIVFGFAEDQDVVSNPFVRMGILVHAENIIKIIDGVLSLLGPNI